MNIRQTLDRLAMAVSLCETDQDDGLKEVLEQLHALGDKDAGAAPDSVGEACRHAAHRLEQAMDEEHDVLMAFVSQCIEFAQAVLESHERGDAAIALSPPWEASGDDERVEADPEMLDVFFSECDESMSRMEGLLLEVEGGENPEAIDELRRLLHTFKGECGVLSLHVAQQLCHEAESLIERTEAGAPPVQVLLELVDWLSRYITKLRANPAAAPQGFEDLLARLETADGGSESVSDERAEVGGVERPEGAIATRETGERVSFPAEALEDETLPEFIEESTSHLDEVEAALLERDENPDDPEILNGVFRAFHTVKGVAGFLNLQPIVALAHKTETLLDELRSHNLEYQQGHSDLIFRSRDLLGEMMQALVGGTAPLVSAVDKLVAELDRAIAGEAVVAGASGAVIVNEALAAVTLDGPDVAENAAKGPAKEWRKIGEILMERTTLDADQLEEALSRQRAEARLGKRRKVGEILIELGLAGEEDVRQALEAQRVDARETRKVPEADVRGGAPESVTRKQRSNSFVKVATQRLDALVDMVGELVIAQQMINQEPALEQIESEDLERKLGHVAKITRDLQEGAMSLRMVTLKSTFQKMARLVRDVAAKSGKQVALHVTGEDTELDRNVVEQIGDPLVHLIRNAIDHGLEPAEDRRKAGKPDKGSLELCAFHQGGSIVIQVRDDGRGLDCDRIFAKAIERGLVPPTAKRKDLSEEEIHRMIFQPGFSTAATVSDISGRGVGMDVVRRNIEGMRGKIEIGSNPGQGSTLTLRLPLTLAIIDGMVVRVGVRRYVIPTLAIEQCFRPDPARLHGILQNGETVDVRGAILAVHRLRDLFYLDEGYDDPADGILVLLESNGQRACFLVDEILGQQQVVIKNLGKALPPMPGVSGGAILGNGRVALILDVDGLLAEARGVAV